MARIACNQAIAAPAAACYHRCDAGQRPCPLPVGAGPKQEQPMSSLKPLIAGNWKMNGLRASLNAMVEVGKGFDADTRRKLDVLI